MSTKHVLGVPAHFEKMLYDTALLSRVYLHAYQASGDPFFRWVSEETLDCLLRAMMYVGAGSDEGIAPGEDYTHLIEGLLELYQTTFDARWYEVAHELAETMIELLKRTPPQRILIRRPSCVKGLTHWDRDKHRTDEGILDPIWNRLSR